LDSELNAGRQRGWKAEGAKAKLPYPLPGFQVPGCQFAGFGEAAQQQVARVGQGRKFGDTITEMSI
jgi:hypothetical protein